MDFEKTTAKLLKLCSETKNSNLPGSKCLERNTQLPIGRSPPKQTKRSKASSKAEKEEKELKEGTVAASVEVIGSQETHTNVSGKISPK